MKVFIKTYGCQSNIADSEQIAWMFKNDLVDNENNADIIIVNTCSVKNASQSKALNYIKKYIKKKKVFVGGCLTKTIDLRKKIPELSGIFDTNSITKLKEIIEKEKDRLKDEKEERILLNVVRRDKDIGIIVISQGCLNKCSYCSTKLARGNLKSYKINDIKKALEKAVKDKCKKIYLTSQDNGCYGTDIKTNLVELLKELVKVKGDYIIRVGMMNPWNVNKIVDELIEVYKNDKIMKFLHLPIESGSVKILKDMKRNYKVEDFKKIVEKFRKEIKEIDIATDVIVGYPTETEKDFLETYKIIEEIKPEVLNISRFSSRPRTEASRLKQLDSEVIKERSKKMHELYWGYRNYSLAEKFHNNLK